MRYIKLDSENQRCVNSNREFIDILCSRVDPVDMERNHGVGLFTAPVRLPEEFSASYNTIEKCIGRLKVSAQEVVLVAYDQNRLDDAGDVVVEIRIDISGVSTSVYQQDGMDDHDGSDEEPRGVYRCHEASLDYDEEALNDFRNAKTAEEIITVIVDSILTDM